MGYHRAGVLLMELADAHVMQGNLFADDPDGKQQQILAVIAAIEAKFGRGAIHFAATGGVAPPWAMRQEFTRGHARGPSLLAGPVDEQLLLPHRPKLLANIIDITEQFE
jgi:hypothetical protein